MRRLGLSGAGVFALMALLFLLPPPARAAHFNYLYIEASEGNSSGGHVAIQFNDEIYHYQHVSPGLIRLFRQNETEFHFLYRYLQNRPMHLSRINVSEETFQLLKDQFKQQFLLQEKQFAWLEALHRDRLSIKRLLHKLTNAENDKDENIAAELRIKGAGLFYSEGNRQADPSNRESDQQQAHSIARVREKVEQRYGAGFLRHKRQQIKSQIKALTPTRWSAFGSDWRADKFPGPIYSFTEKYADCLAGLIAVKALAEAPRLQHDALLILQQRSFAVSTSERSKLQRLREGLESGLIRMLDSNRPDWGYAVLVNLARIIAIDVSLKTGYWVFVDDFADNSEKVGPDQYLAHQAAIRILIRDAHATFNKLRDSASSAGKLTETDYSQIEMMANRYSELLKSGQRRDFRFNGEKALPSRSIGFPEWPYPDLTEAQLRSALIGLDQVESELFERMNQRSRYNLLNRNCVTELFRTIHLALSAPYLYKSAPRSLDLKALTIQESENRLGGYVDMLYNFIPFVSYQAVLAHYNVAASYDLASYRGLELAKLKDRQNPLFAVMRETNIATSRLYRYNPDDAWFVFFTDGNVWLRPLFGLFNTTAGVGQSIVGLFSWPLDSGKNLKSGATGILMSLPEILFFNMRKGSYKYLSFNHLSDTDLPVH